MLQMVKVVIYQNLGSALRKHSAGSKGWAGLCLVLVVLASTISALNLSKQDQASADEEGWNNFVSGIYGDQVENFAYLGDDGLLIEWVNPQTFRGTCSTYSTCDFVRLASVQRCDHGYEIKLGVFDSTDSEKFGEVLPPIIVPLGAKKLLEVDYRRVPPDGYVMLMDAKCGATFPTL